MQVIETAIDGIIKIYKLDVRRLNQELINGKTEKKPTDQI